MFCVLQLPSQNNSKSMSNGINRSNSNLSNNVNERPISPNINNNNNNVESNAHEETTLANQSDIVYRKPELRRKEEKNSRPLSIIAGISELDRQAAEIVNKRNQHRQQLEDQNQQKIDNFMYGVEKKMECLDAIEKHNDPVGTNSARHKTNANYGNLVSD